MNHFYFDIPGWFNFGHIYRMAVEKYDGIFVEIGAWKGCSTAFMAVEIAKSRKNIDFHTIDTFQGSQEDLHFEDPEVFNLREVFDRNIAPVKDFVTVHQGKSTDIVGEFEDGTVSFVFLDGAHDYKSVKADISAWLPKIKPGGLIAGDDIGWSGGVPHEDRPVLRAVQDTLKDWERSGCAWLKWL